MGEPADLADEIDAIFEHCKHILEERPIPHNDFVSTLFKLDDLRRELTKIIGEKETHTIISRAYTEVFPDANCAKNE